MTTAEKIQASIDEKHPETHDLRGSVPKITEATLRGYEKGKEVGFNKQTTNKVAGYLS